MLGQINISKLNNNNDIKKKIDSKVKVESRKNEGMSRAAKKRRKKQEKKIDIVEMNKKNKKNKISSNNKSILLHNNDNDIDIDNDSDSDNENDDNDDNYDDNDDNDDNNNDYDNNDNTNNNNDDSEEDQQHNNKRKFSLKNSSELGQLNEEIDIEITISSIMDLLKLEDIKDIDSYNRSAIALSMIVHPITRSTFYKDYWDQDLLINCKSSSIKKSSSSSSSSSNHKNNKNFFDGLITKDVVMDIIKSHIMYNDIDIKLFKYDGKSLEHAYNESINNDNNNNDDDDNKVEVKFKDVQNKYKMGYTIKLICPQKYHDPIWHYLSLLESEFNISFSASVNLIPPGCKSYPARYDYRHNFIIQIEGSSHWLVYQPLGSEELLDDDDHIVDDILLLKLNVKEITLYSGDTLYIPKCWIYKEQSLTGTHSLYLNIFNNQHNNYSTLLDLLVPEALESLKVKHRKMKQNLPRSLTNLMGVANSESEDPKRNKFTNLVKSLLNDVAKEAVDILDAGSDQLLKSFIANRLPIPMSTLEEEKSALGAPNARIFQYTKLRIVRPGVARAIVEDGKVVVYHCIYNDREHYKTVLSPLEYDLDDGPAIEALLCSYPYGVIVEDLPHPSEEIDDKVSIAQSLYKEGLLIIEDETSAPSKKQDDDDDDDPF